MVKMLPLVT